MNLCFNFQYNLIFIAKNELFFHFLTSKKCDNTHTLYREILKISRIAMKQSKWLSLMRIYNITFSSFFSSGSTIRSFPHQYRSHIRNHTRNLCYPSSHHSIQLPDYSIYVPDTSFPTRTINSVRSEIRFTTEASATTPIGTLSTMI